MTADGENKIGHPSIGYMIQYLTGELERERKMSCQRWPVSSLRTREYGGRGVKVDKVDRTSARKTVFDCGVYQPPVKPVQHRGQHFSHQIFLSRFAISMLLMLSAINFSACSNSNNAPTLSFGPVIVKNQPLSWPKDFERLEPDGHIVLANGRRYRLAGITMRPVSDTHEPDGVRQAGRLIGDEVEIVDAGNGVEAFYKKGKNYYCKDRYKWPHPLTIRHYEKQYERQSVNEMLIETGIARWHADANCDRKTRNRLAKMQQRYDERLQVLPSEARRDRHIYVSPVRWREKFSWSAYRAAGVRMVRPCPGDLERIGLIQLSASR